MCRPEERGTTCRCLVCGHPDVIPRGQKPAFHRMILSQKQNFLLLCFHCGHLTRLICTPSCWRGMGAPLWVIESRVHVLLTAHIPLQEKPTVQSRVRVEERSCPCLRTHLCICAWLCWGRSDSSLGCTGLRTTRHHCRLSSDVQYPPPGHRSLRQRRPLPSHVMISVGK